MGRGNVKGLCLWEIFRRGINISWGNVQTEIVLGGCPDPMQDYKSLGVAVVIWATLVNTQTHSQISTHYIRIAQPAELRTSNSSLTCIEYV